MREPLWRRRSSLERSESPPSESVALTLPLSALALRLAGSPPSVWRVLLLAVVLLLTRPGHWALISGQHAIFLALLSHLALFHARRSPVLSGLALGVCFYKLTYGIPLAVLMLASGCARPVVIGAAVAAVVHTPLLLPLARRAGGVGPFVQKLFRGFRDWQNLKGVDPSSGLDPMSFNHTDVATFVSRFVGHSIPTWASLACAAGVLAIAALGIRRPWLVVASLNTACLVALFAGCVTLARTQSEPAGTLASTGAGVER